MLILSSNSLTTCLRSTHVISLMEMSLPSKNVTMSRTVLGHNMSRELAVLYLHMPGKKRNRKEIPCGLEVLAKVI